MNTRLRPYTHHQSTPASTWTVNHNLGYKPMGDVNILEGGVYTKTLPFEIVHVNDNTLTITFTSAREGIARFV